MTDKAGDIAVLIRKHIQDDLTDEERNALTEWIDRSEENRRVFNELTNEGTLQQALQDLQAFTRQHSDRSDDVVSLYRGKTYWFKYILVAAAVLAVVCMVWLFAISDRKNTPVAVTQTATKKTTQDIAPGGNKAVLTLADGSTIVLDNADNGLIAEQGKTTINKKQNGELEYKAPSKQSASGTAYNIVTTPRGGQYQLTLPDGTKAWLNAASSLRFPVSFNGKERVVELSGEAYFEVAHDASRPFKVNLPPLKGKKSGEVAVLGTHFNVNSYGDDDRIRVTLLQGSVRVSNNREYIIIKPGQQTVVSPNSPLIINLSPDLEQVMAWKEGRFYFDGTDINTVMHQLGRWYDLEVQNQSGVSDIRIGGVIGRNKNLSEVLKALELSDVHFKVEGRKLILTP